MGSRLEDQTFKNREHVEAEVRICSLFGDVCQYLCFIFVALGVIGDSARYALNVTLGLESMSWFLLAIAAGLNAIIGHMHTVVA